MSPYSIELWIAALVITIAVIGGFSVFARWCLNSPAVGRAKLDALQVGMKTTDLKALLGEPRSKRSNEKGNECWVYGAQWKRHVLIVEVNQGSVVAGFVHGVPHLKRTKDTPDFQ